MQLSEYLQNKTKEECFAVFSASRGMDATESCDSHLKHILTLRIRAIAMEWDTHPDPLDLQKVQDAATQVRELPGGKHYLCHLWEALTVTQDHPIWEGQGQKIKEILWIVLAV